MVSAPVPEVLDRRVEDGTLLELVRRGEALDILVDSRRVLRSDVRRGEQQLVDLMRAPLGQRDDVTVVLGGLGMGFTLRALLDAPGIKQVDVIEGSPAMREWEARYFAGLNGDALKDPRVRLHGVDFGTFVKALRTGDVAKPPGDGWLGLLLDFDEGPARLWRAANSGLYDDDGMERLESVLRPGGVVTLWSATREPALLQRLNARFKHVAEVVVPVELDGESSLDYVYRGRRAPHEAVSNKPLN